MSGLRQRVLPGVGLGIALALGGIGAEASARPQPEHIEEGLPPWMTHGTELRLEIAENLLESANTAGALEVLRLMREDGHEEPELDLLQGEALRIDGVSSEAERLLLRAQKRMREDGRPSAQLCLLYADQSQIAEAIAACDRAVRLDDHDAKSANNLAYLLLSERRYEEALKAAERAVELDGGDARYRNNLGLIQASLGRDDLAFRTLKTTMPPADAAYMVGLAVEHATAAPDGSAVGNAGPWFEKALELEPGHRLTLAHLQGADAPPVGPPRVPEPPGEAPAPPVAPESAPQETPQ